MRLFPVKRLLINLLKIAISLGLLAWLLTDSQNREAFSKLGEQPKHWGMLAVALAFGMLGVTVTILRWYYLVRAVELPFSVKDALRLGFLGYLLNFFSLGSVGGDLFKAVFIAREQHQRRAAAVATVVVDRLIGLYALFLVAVAAMLLGGQLNSPVPEIRVLCWTTLIAATVALVMGGVLLMPGLADGRVARFLSNRRRTGRIFEQIFSAVRMYRQRWSVLLGTTLASVGVHVSFVLCFYFIGLGLPNNEPTLAEHFVVVPLALVTGALPLPMAGLGAFEAAVEFLYVQIGTGVPNGQGLLVSFGYRAITIIIAGIGLAIYLASRREMSRVLHEVEEETAEHEGVFTAGFDALASDTPGEQRGV